MELENYTRDEKIAFLSSPVWAGFRSVLLDKKQECYEAITDENSSVSKVKSKADKLSVIDELFILENEIIESLNKKGE